MGNGEVERSTSEGPHRTGPIFRRRWPVSEHSEGRIKVLGSSNHHRSPAPRSGFGFGQDRVAGRSAQPRPRPARCCRPGPRSDRRAAPRRHTHVFVLPLRRCIRLNVPRWRNAKHADGWIRSLENHAMPKLGAMPVDRIERALTCWPSWSRSGPPNPKQLAGSASAIKVVFGYCQAHGYIENNPAGDAINGALPSMRRTQQHFRSMPHLEDFRRAQGRGRGRGGARLQATASASVILTAARTRRSPRRPMGRGGHGRPRMAPPARTDEGGNRAQGAIVGRRAGRPRSGQGTLRRQRVCVPKPPQARATRCPTQR